MFINLIKEVTTNITFRKPAVLNILIQELIMKYTDTRITI